MKKKNKFSSIKMLQRYSKGLKGYMVLAILCCVIGSALNTATPQIIRFTVDSIIEGTEETLSVPVQQIFSYIEGSTNVESLFHVVLLIVALACITGVFTYFTSVLSSKSSEMYIKRLKDTLFAHVQNVPLDFHVKHQTGDLIQRCTSDTEVVRKFLSTQLMQVFRTAFMVIFSIIMMWSMSMKLSLIAIIFMPIILFYTRIFYEKIAKEFHVADAAEGDLASVVQENLSGVRVVRAFAAQQFEVEKFDEKNETYANSWMRLGRITGAYWGIGDFITGLQIAIITALGVVEVVSGQITTGEFIAFIAYNQSLIWPIRTLGRILADTSKMSVSFERIQYILDTEIEVDVDSAIKPAMDTDIEFKHVSFSYEEHKVLDDVSFRIKAGETFAILGGTGSGKSTLVQLVNRLYELPVESGNITIGGVDTREIELKWLRKHIGIVLQEPFLFSRTIGENIKAARPEVDDVEMREAADIACIDSSIQEFTNGYDTVVGEKGITLSGGQKQRVAIARMLLQKAPIMIFDDSLSAVDAQTDSYIRKALKDNMKHSTVIIISHRITTLMGADQIMVLDKGKVSQLGSHQELLDEEGIYKQIYEIQMKKEVVE